MTNFHRVQGQPEVKNFRFPLGQVAQVIWTRNSKPPQLTAKELAAWRQRSSFEEKESARWLEILQDNEQLARRLPQPHRASIRDL